jgi:hypothetical protein
MRLMSHRKELALFALVAVVLVVSWRMSGFLHRGRGSPREIEVKQAVTAADSDPAPSQGYPVTTDRKPSRIARFLAKEAENVGKTTDDPQSAEKRLKEFADTLKSEDLKDLAARAVDPKTGGDERFLSAYLLGLADSAGAEDAQNAMISVAGSAVPQLPLDSPVRAMELSIRAEALEGMAKFRDDPGARAKLTELIQQLKDPFLADRAHRVLYALDHGGEGVVPAQDAAALQKMLNHKD